MREAACLQPVPLAPPPPPVNSSAQIVGKILLDKLSGTNTLLSPCWIFGCSRVAPRTQAAKLIWVDVISY